MATLRERKWKHTIYHIDYHYEGKRHVVSTGTGDYKKAKIMLKEYEAKIANGTLDSEKSTPKKPIELREFFDEYLEYSSKRKTRKSYMRDRLIFKHFEKFVGSKPLASIDRKLVDNYSDHRVTRVSKSTVNLELRHLKAAFTVAVEWGHVDKNPLRRKKPYPVPQRSPNYFTNKQISLLLDCIEEAWLREVVVFAVNTGVRIGELVNVEWKDVDFDNREVRIRNKQDFMTKSKKERPLPINDELFDLLVGMKRRGSHIFSNARGQRRDSLRVSKHFKKYVRIAALEDKFTFHSLRHTFASHLVQRGVSIYIVSKLLGHSNIKTTEVYAHLAPETFHDAVSLLGVLQPAASTQLSVVRAKQANLDG